MTPPLKLFISYRSLDSAKVDAIRSVLATQKNADGTPYYRIWQDKDGISSGSDWWESIVDAIIDCQIVVFFVSQESIKSHVCLAELRYAFKRNRFIIPVVLEGEFWISDKTGKPDLAYWDQLPPELTDHRIQFLFYKGTGFIAEFKKAADQYDPVRYRDIAAPRPLNPEGDGYNTDTLYQQACDYAQASDFEAARDHFQRLVRSKNAMLHQEASEWIDLLVLYEDLLTKDLQTSTRFLIPDMWDNYAKQFPKPFINDIFDPKNIAARAEAIRVIKPPRPPAKILGELFEWVEIPAGYVTLEAGGSVPRQGQRFAVEAFRLGKYPITNAHYAKFIEAGGYKEARWWTPTGWDIKEKGLEWVNREFKPSGHAWQEPRFWTDKRFNRKNHPVVGISWYEAIAFCLWLSDVWGETIMLPTEQQWQYAAQGEKRLLYSWGNDWDGSRCNNSVSPQTSHQTTAVNQYAAQANGHGLVDMTGNVWEWCLTGYDKGVQSTHDESPSRVLRGGSWENHHQSDFHTTYRNRNAPTGRLYDVGFRCAAVIL